MKVLHISDQPPGFTSGGQLGILQFSYAWTHIGAEVDYIGPAFDNTEIREWYHKVNFLNKKPCFLEKIYSICRLQFDRKFISWKAMKINFEEYDLIYIDFTKMAYVLRDIKASGYKGKIIVRAHNVEADFFEINYRTNKSMVNYIKYKAAKPREKYMVRNSDYVLAITDQDKNRLMQLYNVEDEKVLICPVGVNTPINNPAFKTNITGRVKGLITGSMWFGPNVNATMWFIEEVYPSIKNECELTVAGYKPNNELKRKCKEAEIRIVDSPESMVEYFNWADIIFAPIFEGGGMKVKIAEAMSYALPIVTTTHGAIGYSVRPTDAIYVVDDAEGFISAIHFYLNSSEEEKMRLLESEYSLYTNKYSLHSIRDYIQNLCSSFR